jgi:hypothetical protein
MYGFTLRGPASRLADAEDSPSPSSSFCGARGGMTSGRVSNLIGAGFSLATLAAGAFMAGAFMAGTLMAGALTAAGTGFAAASAGLAAASAGLAAAAAGLAGAGFGVSALGVGLLGFTVTLDVEDVGVDLAGGRAAFLSKAGFGVAFLDVAFPGRLAALFGFFEGI